MTWVLLLLLGLAVLGGTGSKRPNRFRPTRRRIHRKRNPLAGSQPRTRRGLQLDLPKPFDSGEVEGTLPQDFGGTVSFDLGEVPDGDVVYTAAVEFEGAGVQGSGFYRLIIDEQPGGMSEIQVGPVMASTPVGSEHWLPNALKLSAYLVDPDQGVVGFAGFSFSAGRMLFSVAQSTIIPMDGVRVRVKWHGFET